MTPHNGGLARCTHGKIDFRLRLGPSTFDSAKFETSFARPALFLRGKCPLHRVIRTEINPFFYSSSSSSFFLSHPESACVLSGYPNACAPCIRKMKVDYCCGRAGEENFSHFTLRGALKSHYSRGKYKSHFTDRTGKIFGVASIVRQIVQKSSPNYESSRHSHASASPGRKKKNLVFTLGRSTVTFIWPRRLLSRNKKRRRRCCSRDFYSCSSAPTEESRSRHVLISRHLDWESKNRVNFSPGATLDEFLQSIRPSVERARSTRGRISKRFYGLKYTLPADANSISPPESLAKNLIGSS